MVLLQTAIRSLYLLREAEMLEPQGPLVRLGVPVLREPMELPGLRAVVVRLVHQVPMEPLVLQGHMALPEQVALLGVAVPRAHMVHRAAPEHMELRAPPEARAHMVRLVQAVPRGPAGRQEPLVLQEPTGHPVPQGHMEPAEAQAPPAVLEPMEPLVQVEAREPTGQAELVAPLGHPAQVEVRDHMEHPGLLAVREAVVLLGVRGLTARVAPPAPTARVEHLAVLVQVVLRAQVVAPGRMVLPVHQERLGLRAHPVQELPVRLVQVGLRLLREGYSILKGRHQHNGTLTTA